MASISEAIRDWFNQPIIAKIEEVGLIIMANEADRLQQVADQLNNNLFPAISQLLQENATLRSRNAELAGEDAAESAATDNVVVATQNVSNLFSDPDVPDVEPIEPPA